MNHKRIFISLLVLLVLILISAGMVLAQESEPPKADPGVNSPESVNANI